MPLLLLGAVPQYHGARERSEKPKMRINGEGAAHEESLA